MNKIVQNKVEHSTWLYTTRLKACNKLKIPIAFWLIQSNYLMLFQNNQSINYIHLVNISLKQNVKFKDQGAKTSCCIIKNRDKYVFQLSPDSLDSVHKEA